MLKWVGVFEFNANVLNEKILNAFVIAKLSSPNLGKIKEGGQWSQCRNAKVHHIGHDVGKWKRSKTVTKVGLCSSTNK